jgi:threonine dehydrogenase-like Zn-dependent dehydrogenase
MAELERGRLDPLPLVSHRLPLEEAPKGYELFEDRRATKVLLTP